MPPDATRAARAPRHPPIFAWILPLLAIAPLGCAGPPRSSSGADHSDVDAAGASAAGGGVIVAIRALPRDGATMAEVGRAAGIGMSFGPSAAQGPGFGTAWEFIVLVDGRGPISVVQGDADQLTVGARVRLLPGARTRITPAAG